MGILRNIITHVQHVAAVAIIPEIIFAELKILANSLRILCARASSDIQDPAVPQPQRFAGNDWIALHQQKARGLMARYMIDNRIEYAEQLKNFDAAGYQFEASQSSENEWVFTRQEQ